MPLASGRLRSERHQQKILSSVQFSSVDSLRPHEPQHARPPCPSPTAGVYPNPCPLSRGRGESQGECVFPRLASAVLLPARALDCDLPCSLPGFLNSASVWLFTPRAVQSLLHHRIPPPALMFLCWPFTHPHTVPDSPLSNSAHPPGPSTPEPA